MLLIGAGVLVASFERVLNINPGFRPANVLSGTLAFPASRYATDDSVRSTIDRILEKVRAIPGVQVAGATNSLPFSGNYSDSVILAEGYQMSKGESLISPSKLRRTAFRGDGSGLRKAVLTADDTVGRQHVLIIDETLAKFAQRRGAGQAHVQSWDINNIMKPPVDEDADDYRIIAPTGFAALLIPERPKCRRLLSMRQSVSHQIYLAIRTAVAQAAPTRTTRGRADPSEMPFYGVRTMEDRLSASLIDRRTPTLLAPGLRWWRVLAAIGIYGVLAYQVPQRGEDRHSHRPRCNRKHLG